MARKRRHSVPKAKRMKRSGRLQSGVSWLKKYEGNNVLRGYCKHFGVDWRCAAIELRQLGVKLDPNYLKQREQTEREAVKARRQSRNAREACASEDAQYESPFAAYLAEDYAALYAMECERDGIDPVTGF